VQQDQTRGNYRIVRSARCSTTNRDIFGKGNAMSQVENKPKSEVREGMRIDWDVQIEMDDGLVLRADVFRPIKEGRYPVLLSYGP
jgi:predicted acyl esterase